jgi:hypothetical protein
MDELAIQREIFDGRLNKEKIMGQSRIRKGLFPKHIRIRIPEGGDHVPSSFLAISTPEPPAPDTHNPVRITVNTARPTQFWITF